MTRVDHMRTTHRYPAISSHTDSPFGTLLGWCESAAEASEAVQAFQSAKPVSFEELMRGVDD